VGEGWVMEVSEPRRRRRLGWQATVESRVPAGSLIRLVDRILQA